ncbi:MAG: TIGR03619 family F420-dependent LLM class oxidoreductase, partial [Chloroflexi bacterium]|nr:TIGR03619 family F420-dependent LLM class oxidoreductase [Chloroflexota bacterium]
ILMYSPVLEGLTSLATLVSKTRQITLGTCVLLLPLRHPTVVAKMVATLDYLAKGRIIFGVGVGGEVPLEFEACEVPARQRGGRTDEAIAILRGLWADPPRGFAGRYHNIPAVDIQPKPAQRSGPPIWVGGRSEAALKRAARLGDGWVSYLITPQRLRESVTKIAELADAAGRNPSDIASAHLFFLHVDHDRERARQQITASLSQTYRQPFEKLVDRYCAFGPPEECARRIVEFATAGAQHVILRATCPPQELMNQLELWANEVRPLVQQMVI